tara:strand:- start:20527 stop:20952 length:426 start_codon:yes stop_codon:yes gene_type:complete
MASFMACDKDDDKTEDRVTAEDITEIKTIINNGEWYVSYFLDSDEDDTDNFLGYGFIFNVSGVLAATDGNTALSGAWSIAVSDADDSSDGEVEFDIVFNAPDNFEELSEDWHIVKYTKSKIELENVSDASGGTDYLTFEKN